MPLDWCLKYLKALNQFYRSHTDLAFFKSDKTHFLTWVIPGGTCSAWTNFLQGLPINEEYQPVIDLIYELWTFLGTLELTDDEGRTNYFFLCYRDIFSSLLCNNSSNKAALPLLKAFIPGCMEWKNKNKDDLEDELVTLKDFSTNVITSAMSTLPELFSSNFEPIIKSFIANHGYSDASSLSTVYEKDKWSRKTIEAYIKDLVNILPKLKQDHPAKSHLMMLFYHMGNSNPMVFEPHIATLEPFLEDSNYSALLLQVFQSVAKKNPNVFRGKGDNYIKMSKKTMNHPSAPLVAMPILKEIAKIDEKEAQRVIAMMEKELSANEESSVEQTVLYYWSELAFVHPEPLKKRMALLQKLKQKPALRQSATNIINILEGRSLETISKRVGWDIYAIGLLVGLLGLLLYMHSIH